MPEYDGLTVDEILDSLDGRLLAGIIKRSPILDTDTLMDFSIRAEREHKRFTAEMERRSRAMSSVEEHAREHVRNIERQMVFGPTPDSEPDAFWGNSPVEGLRQMQEQLNLMHEGAAERAVQSEIQRRESSDAEALINLQNHFDRITARMRDAERQMNARLAIQLRQQRDRIEQDRRALESIRGWQMLDYALPSMAPQNFSQITMLS